MHPSVGRRCATNYGELNYNVRAMLCEEELATSQSCTLSSNARVYVCHDPTLQPLHFDFDFAFDLRHGLPTSPISLTSNLRL